MEWPLAVAIASLALTVGVGFTTIGRTLGRIEVKVDTMWAAFVGGDSPDGHARRRSDRIFHGLADDDPNAPEGDDEP